MAQRADDLSWLQPCGVIGVEIGEYHEAGAIENVGGRHRSLNRGAVLPPFKALATRPVSVSAWIERRAASTTLGSAFASYSRRHASSCAFNDIERHRASEAEHAVHFSFRLTCDTPIV